jgi:uncharacterized peroxidase-related enzyme
MSRIAIPTFEQSLPAAQPFLTAVQKSLGVLPNLMKVVGHSPSSLEGYLSLSGATGKGSLSVQLRERIALTTAQYNGCDYCLSVHSYLSANAAKISQTEIDSARVGNSEDAKTDAALKFALQVLTKKGQVSDADLTAVRAAGFDDAAIVEIVTNVSLNVLTNFINNVAHTDIDFPVVSAAAI